METPTAAAIRQAREASGLSRAKAAELIHKSVRTWEKWEMDERPMDPAFFELFLIKAPKPPKPKKRRRKAS